MVRVVNVAVPEGSGGDVAASEILMLAVHYLLLRDILDY